MSRSGRFFSFSEMHVNPKPVQEPHPPIWIGGVSDAALRRAARFAALWQPTPLPPAELVERQTTLHQACGQIGRAPIPTRMSFRIEFNTITGNAPPLGRKRPVGHGTPSEVAGDLLSYREKADLDAFQINLQLLQSMDCYMQDVAPIVSGERPI
jgi:Luciferase-like monooxygenase